MTALKIGKKSRSLVCSGQEKFLESKFRILTAELTACACSGNQSILQQRFPGRSQRDLENSCSQTWNKAAKNGPNLDWCVLRAPHPNARYLREEFGASRLWSRAQLRWCGHIEVSLSFPPKCPSNQPLVHFELGIALKGGVLCWKCPCAICSGRGWHRTSENLVLVPHLPFLQWQGREVHCIPQGMSPRHPLSMCLAVGHPTEAHLAWGTLTWRTSRSPQLCLPPSPEAEGSCPQLLVKRGSKDLGFLLLLSAHPIAPTKGV